MTASKKQGPYVDWDNELPEELYGEEQEPWTKESLRLFLRQFNHFHRSIWNLVQDYGDAIGSSQGDGVDEWLINWYDTFGPESKIELQGTDYRYRDEPETYYLEFPLSVLYDPEGIQKSAEEQREKRRLAAEAEAQRKEAARLKNIADQEERERKEYERLKKKYSEA